LLLSALVMTQTATAFAVEGGENVKEAAKTGNALTEGSAALDSVSSENCPSPEEGCDFPEDSVSSEDSDFPEDSASPGDDAFSGKDPASGDSVSSEGAALPAEPAISKEGTVAGEEAFQILLSVMGELNAVLEKKTVRAAVFNCRECPLKAEPSEGAETLLMLPSAATVELKSLSLNEGAFWFEVKACLGESEAHGYIRKENVVCVDEDYVNFEKELISGKDRFFENMKNGLGLMSTNAGSDSLSEVSRALTDLRSFEDLAKSTIDSFPENYRDKLYALNAAHPSWVFVPQNLDGLTLEAVVNGEYSNRDRNWIYYTAPESYREGLTKDTSGKWYYASKSCITYYMNPLNFMDDSHIFQFEQLAYNSSYHTKEGVQSILNGTFMKGMIEYDTMTYADAFMTIGKELGLSPYHLSSRVRLEQGVKGESPLISGKYPGYEGLYNYFNIKASDPNKVENGLKYAREQGWNTRYKSLRGGAAFLGNGYISAGQDTLYLEKFDLVGTLYTHQYMQNIQAPSSEAVTTYNQYKNSGTVNNAFIFKIPVFTDAKGGGSAGKDTVNELKKQVSFTLIKKANLFYSEEDPESFALYRVNSNVDISGISTSETAASKAGTEPYFEVLDLSGNILSLKTRGRTGANTQDTRKKAFITVSSPEGDFEASLNVSTQNSRPALKASPAVIYEGFESGISELTDSSGKALSLPEDLKVTAEDAGIKCSVSAGSGLIEVRPSKDFKAGSKTFRLESAGWTKPLTLKVQVKRGTVPVLKLSSKSPVLNTLIPMEKYGTLNIRAGLVGSGISLNSLSINGGNAKSEEALNSWLSAVYDGERQVLRLGLKETGAQKGSYSLILKATVKATSGTEISLKDLKLNVKVIEKEKEKAFTLKGSGRINLVDRADSCLVLTPGFSGTGASKIRSVSLEDSPGFEALLLKKGECRPDGKLVTAQGGVIALRALDGAELEKGRAYPLGITCVLDNGLEVKKVLSIKLGQTPAKVYGNIITAAMTRSSSTSRNFIIRSKGLTAADSVIEKVEPDFGSLSDKFSYLPFEGQGGSRKYAGIFELKDRNIADGTYSLKFKVFLKGRGVNTDPVKVVLKVRIK